MIQFKNLSKYDGMFTRCWMEPARDGLSLFDHKSEFVGMIVDEGFCLNRKYKHADTIEKMLIEKGFAVVGYREYEQVRSENDLSEALYGEPK